MTDRITYQHCPLCNSSATLHEKTADISRHPLYVSALSPIINWKKCADCRHIFTEGYYAEAACKLIFSKTNENQKVGAFAEQNRYISAKMVEKVLPYASDGSWLDVGFGNGSLLFTAQEYGFRPVGIDARVDTVNEMNSIGVEAYCHDLCDLSTNEKFSVISMADVLEHIPYPKPALRAAHRLLGDGGVLLISMPNIESIVWKMLDQQNANPYWMEMEHYHNFSRSRLFSLLAECGMTPVLYGVSERYRVCMEVIALKKRGDS